MNRREAIRARAVALAAAGELATELAAPAPRVPIEKPAAKLPGDGVGRIRWTGQGRDEAAAEAATKPWWDRRKSDAPSPPSNGWWCWALKPIEPTP